MAASNRNEDFLFSILSSSVKRILKEGITMFKSAGSQKTALTVAALFAFAILLAGCSAASTQAAALSPAEPAQATAGTASENPSAASVGAHYTISLDVNPSIELEVTDGIVTNVIAYNDDAAALDLASLVVGLEPREAVEVLVGALADGGYLSPELAPYLVITVSDEPDSPQIAEQLEQSAINALETLQIECTVKSAVITQEISQTAASYGLSSGKYLILDYIASQEGITLEEAIAQYGSLRIAELMEQYAGAQELFVDEAGAQIWREEQLQAAIALFEQEMYQVMDQFHAAFRLVKDTYKAGVQNLKDTYGNAGDPQYRSELKVLKEAMLSGRQEALAAMKSGKEAAWAKLLETALALGYTEEDIQACLAMAEEYQAQAQSEADGLLAEADGDMTQGDPQEQEDTGKPAEPGNSSNAQNKDKTENPGKAAGKEKDHGKKTE